MLNRRSFFKALTGGIGAVIVSLDPEKALWVPGSKLISIPKPRFDPRFLVRLRPGQLTYSVPPGIIARITAKLPGHSNIETAVQLIAPHHRLPWLEYDGPIRYAAVTPGYPQDHLLVWPAPARDSVIAVEYAC
jgi:hypothetical protein